MHEKQIDKMLVGIAHGDNIAFEELYNATKRGVFSFVYSYMKNYEDAEDVMQTVYLKIKLNIDKYAPGTNARGWILQIAKNQALNELKKRARTNSDDATAATDASIADSPVMAVMQSALTQDERVIVDLHVLWGYRHREIAKLLDCPVGTVTSKYNRSIKKLKKALKEAE